MLNELNMGFWVKGGGGGLSTPNRSVEPVYRTTYVKSIASSVKRTESHYFFQEAIIITLESC